MFKAIVISKRKPGMSAQQFRDYYETVHAPLAISRIPNLRRYVRNYVRPYGNEVYDAPSEQSFDVVTEIWFDDEAEFHKGMAHLTETETARLIGEDEPKFLDQSSIRFFLAEECEIEIK